MLMQCEIHRPDCKTVGNGFLHACKLSRQNTAGSKRICRPLMNCSTVTVCLATLAMLLLFAPLRAKAQFGKPKPPKISAEFPFESKYVEILGSRMHYVDVGQGDPILFLHGNPTSSYLWRNIISHLSDQGRAIAVDLIGMGRSDQPKLDYTYADHRRYLDAFIQELGLENVTLVIHDWGSALGFDYASRHEDNIVGIAFMEAIVPPTVPVADYAAMGPAGAIFKAMRTPGQGEKMILEQNFFIEVILPGAVVRSLSDEEKAAYRAPYPTPESRKPTLQWPREVPIAGEPKESVELVTRIGEWMRETSLPMLHLWASPGALNPEPVAKSLVEEIENLQSSYIGTGIHYIQEDHPVMIGRTIADWRRRLYKNRK